MMALQANPDFQVFLFRFFRGREDTTHAGRICCHWLFHEDVFALPDRFLEMDRTEAGWRGENYHVGQ